MIMRVSHPCGIYTERIIPEMRTTICKRVKK